MKAVLEFDLDDQDDKMAFRRASASTEAYLVLWNLAHQCLRNMIRYRELTDEQDEIVLEIQGWLFNELELHGINLEDLP